MHAEADANNAYGISAADADKVFMEGMANEIYNSINSALSSNTDPWSAREVSYALADKNFVTSTAPAWLTKVTSDLNSQATREKASIDAETTRVIDEQLSHSDAEIEQRENEIEVVQKIVATREENSSLLTHQALTRDIDNPEGQENEPVSTTNGNGQSNSGSGTNESLMA